MKNTMAVILIMITFLVVTSRIIAQETPAITVYANGPYEVWAGNTDCGNYYGCNDPEIYCGYDFLGSGNTTNTFDDSENHLYYIITTYSEIGIDAIKFPNGYFTTYLRSGNRHCKEFEYDAFGNLIGNAAAYACNNPYAEYERLSGPPDGIILYYGLPTGASCGAGPYVGGIIVFHGHVGDFSWDGDVDGSDLAAYIAGEFGISLNVIAENFGVSI